MLLNLNIRPSATAADFGCGSGGWTIPLAEILDKGRVFAVDIQEEALSALSSETKISGVSNIKTILADAEEGVREIKDNSCDFVLMTDLLFQVDKPEKVFAEAKRVLLPGGRLFAVEWNPASPIGPQEGKLSPEKVEELAKSEGLEKLKEVSAGDYHFALLFKNGNV